MEDVFHQYMTNRFSTPKEKKSVTKPGPIITISRIAGCSSQRLSRELAQRLKEISNKEWTVISKEVLKESASKLNVNTKNIKTIFKVKDRNVLEDIMKTFVSKDYQLERKMRNTVVEVIKEFANDGYKVILGRGGNIICSDIDDAIHIRVVGPLNWRIKRVMKSRNCSKQEAQIYITETEKNRNSFRKSIKGKAVNCDDFDLTFNQKKYSNKEIIEIIIKALQMKHII